MRADRRSAVRTGIGLLTGVACLHLAFALAQPTPRPMGDEQHYLAFARGDLRRGDTSPWPGQLRFAQRPELQSRLLARLMGDPDTPNEIVLWRAELLQLGLLLALTIAVFVQARLLGYSSRVAWLASAVVALLPWFAIHVHTLWPEILHALLLAIALACSLDALGRLAQARASLGRVAAAMAAAGAAIGVALLTKGVALPAIPLLVGFPMLESLRARDVDGRHEGIRRTGRGLLRATSIGLAFAIGALLVVGPQLQRNVQRGVGARLAANTWWNLELGLHLSTDPRDATNYDADADRWLGRETLHERYVAASPGAVERERAARERTLAALGERLAAAGSLALIADQARKLADLWRVDRDLIAQRRATLDQAVGHRRRWGDAPPAWLPLLNEIGRWSWRALLPLGLAGLLLAARRSTGHALLATLAVTLLAACLAIPLKVRFLLPLVPLLALGLAEGLSRALSRRPPPPG